jgi:hypothetical protein
VRPFRYLCKDPRFTKQPGSWCKRLISSVNAVVVHSMFMTVEENLEIAQRKKFRYGLLLAWAPLIFFIVPIAQMSSEKATGLAAVAGGVSEVAATFGLVVIVASEVVAIVMLIRTFSRSHLTRTVVAIFSVGCSGLLLLVLGLFLWFAIGHR